MKKLIKFVVELVVLALLLGLAVTRWSDVLAPGLPWLAAIVLVYMTWDNLLDVQSCKLRLGRLATRHRMFYLIAFLGGGGLATLYLYGATHAFRKLDQLEAATHNKQPAQPIPHLNSETSAAPHPRPGHGTKLLSPHAATEVHHGSIEPFHPALGSTPPPPKLAGIRIASQDQVVSTNPTLPYGLRVVLQTDEPISPVSFLFTFSGVIGEGNAMYTGAFMQSVNTVVPGSPTELFSEWASPAFTADEPIIVTIFSNTYVRMTAFERRQYVFPITDNRVPPPYQAAP